MEEDGLMEHEQEDVEDELRSGADTPEVGINHKAQTKQFLHLAGLHLQSTWFECHLSPLAQAQGTCSLQSACSTSLHVCTIDACDTGL